MKDRRACREGTSSLYEDYHKAIIDDCNGLETGAPVGGVDADAELCAGFLGLPCRDVEETENDDELAPLPLPMFGSKLQGWQKEGVPVFYAEPPVVRHVVLALDTSGSMRNADVTISDGRQQLESVSRLSAATTCAAQFVRSHRQQNPQDVFSLVTFGSVAQIECRVVDEKTMLVALDSICTVGAQGTSYLAALEAIMDVVSAKSKRHNHVVFLSDGRPGDVKKALELFQSEFLRGKCAGTCIHGIGFGATVQSFAALQQLTSLSAGSFVLSSCSMQGLSQAFGSVSATITVSSSACSHADDSATPSDLKRTPRLVTYEEPEIREFGRKNVLRFCAARKMFQYDGQEFQQKCFPSGEVVRRLHPYMRGGMRLVYGFRDAQIVQSDSSWMVAKASRFSDAVCNAAATVEAHAKSTAVARYYAGRFNACLQSQTSKRAAHFTIYFVPCYVYSVSESQTYKSDEPTIFMAERFLPGAFLKYNSNNGYVCDGSTAHQEAVQAFTHFTFVASGGKVLVADLQGVARDAEALLTDPQVLSRGRRFGPGDLGESGMKACLAAHRCGPTCKKLGLEPVSVKLLSKLGPMKSGHVSRPCSSRLGGSWERLSDTSSHRVGVDSAASWDHVQEMSAAEDFERLSEPGLVRYVLSDGGGSSRQSSVSSWVHLLDS